VRNTVATYRRLLLETAGVTDERLSSHGAVVGEQLERERPDLLAEVEGMASGAGVVVEELLAVNARTELLGGRGAGECSLVGRIDGAGVRLAQNWDWHPALAASALVWTIAPPGGPWLTTVTEAGMLAKVGVNSRGVAVGLNFLSSTLDGIAGDGVPIHVLLRMVLDSCGSAAEALRLLLGATVSASSCVTVAGSEGDGCALAALELSPAGHGIVWPDARGTLVHTNHFLAEAGRPHEAGVVEDPATLLRLRHLAGALAGGRALEEVLRSHFPQPHAVCRHVDERDPWAERRATLLSVSIDPGAGRLRVTAGPPCERAYEAVERVA
jgi:isopenicillin-N N-acyltransferase-like protein